MMLKRIILLFFIVCFSSFANAHATDIQKQKEALNVIADFADRMCDDIPLIGSSENLELSGEAKAELNKLLKKVADIGFEGSARYQKEQFNNVLQGDLATVLSSSRRCKLELWEGLQDKFLISG